MPEIRQLPASVVNKIAAGEVIERPSSVVKELLENAVDAGATRIDVSIAQGGSELVRVSDNGHGMRPEQLPLAVASHATSKIRDADDLFRVGTLGFRGEALASIASVSQLTIRSRTDEDQAGAELEVVGGQVGTVQPCGAPVGTTIEVRNLFYNTPVRRKFLRTAATEVGHASEALTRIALAYPHVHFTLRHNDRSVLDLPPVACWRERIATLFGPDLAEALIDVGSVDGTIRLAGYVAHPEHSRANNRMQYLFLNGRHIRDRSLQHALGEAYRGLLLSGRFPIAFLRLEMAPEEVDVNVHPTKLEVRFQEAGRIYSQLLGTLRTRFLSTDLNAKVRTPTPAAEGAAAAHDPQAAEQLRSEFVDWAKGELNTARPVGEVPQEQAELDLAFAASASPGLTLNRLDRSWPLPGRAAPSPASPGTIRHSESDNAASRPVPRANPAMGEGPSSTVPAVDQATGRPAMQVHNRYLITESDEGMVVIDQHALHERILYEQLRQRVVGGVLETQQLLVPEPVHLTPAEAAAVLQAQEPLSQLGIEVQPFGGDTVLVCGYPAMLANLGPAEILRQVVELLMAGGKAPQRRDVLDELLHMISCKAAIKAGDRLSSQEITALLQQRHLVQDAHHCPHGRPTSLVFTREELDKRFKRT